MYYIDLELFCEEIPNTLGIAFIPCIQAPRGGGVDVGIHKLCESLPVIVTLSMIYTKKILS